MTRATARTSSICNLDPGQDLVPLMLLCVTYSRYEYRTHKATDSFPDPTNWESDSSSSLPLPSNSTPIVYWFGLTPSINPPHLGLYTVPQCYAASFKETYWCMSPFLAIPKWALTSPAPGLSLPTANQLAVPCIVPTIVCHTMAFGNIPLREL